MEQAVPARQRTADSTKLEYAQKFTIDNYEGGYALITVADDGRFLVVPEGKEAPADLAKDITVLQQPIQNIYLVASAVMDMFVSLDALDTIRFSGTKTEGWYIDAAKAAMENGDILYAGKYSAPDYEQILAQNCGLAWTSMAPMETVACWKIEGHAQVALSYTLGDAYTLEYWTTMAKNIEEMGFQPAAPSAWAMYGAFLISPVNTAEPLSC